MYSFITSFSLGFHGCDKSIAEITLAGEDRLSPSKNDYDWLGHGIYFWEYSPERAFEYAQYIKDHPERCKSKIAEPFALGAIINHGRCLNFLHTRCLQILREAHGFLQESVAKSKGEMPANKQAVSGEDFILRFLDCAAIEMVHTANIELKRPPYDTVRGAFWEGKELYEGAGFREKDHIQICVINPNCIKGYFRPLTSIPGFDIP